MQGTEVVFHLAASVGNKRSIDQLIIDAEINILGTLQILETARKAGSIFTDRPSDGNLLVSAMLIICG